MVVGGRGSGGISRARFLGLAGLGAGVSLFPGVLGSFGGIAAQVAGGAEILGGSYPIVAWWPPPPVPNTDPDPAAETTRRYAELAGANFNAVVGGNGVSNLRANRLALDACEANNLRLVLDDGELRNVIEGAVRGTARTGEQKKGAGGVLRSLDEGPQPDAGARGFGAPGAADRAGITRRIEELYAEFGPRPGMAGVLLYDEPGRSAFPTLRFAREEVGRVFGGDELPYVNAWPSYASPENALEAPSYADYLRFYLDAGRYPGSAVASPFLSFDHYPLLAKGRTTADFFYNHAVVRDFALRFGVPSWAFVQSVGFDARKIFLGYRRPPDEAEIFWQINIALAYGVKGIQYFTYWTPENDEVRFGDAQITRAGARTPLYDYARRANGYLARIGAVLLPLTSVSATHANEPNPPRGARPFRANSCLKATGGDPVVLGFFAKPGTPAERYLLVSNRSPNRPARARLTISGNVRSVAAFDPSAGTSGAFVPVKIPAGSPRYLSAAVSPGRARLYRFRTG